MTSRVYDRPYKVPPLARARRKGWRVQPGVYLSDSDPHAFSEPCKCARNIYGLCPCASHGVEGQIARAMNELPEFSEAETPHVPNLSIPIRRSGGAK